jgi:Icc-related predicted phosphoesterase
MKFAFCSDAHGRFSELEKIEADKIFFLGDMFANKVYVNEFGRDLLRFYYKKIDAEELTRRFITKNKNIKEDLQIPDVFTKRNFLILPGNHENTEFFSQLTKLGNLQNIHLKKIEIGSVKFAGHGGIIIPDNMMEFERHFSFSSETIAENLLKMNIDKNSILLMHELPITEYSIEIRSVIEGIKPKLVIGCHNHRGPLETVINDIKYLNCGALFYGKYKILDINT